MAKDIGKAFFSGKLNLTTVPMPIEINACISLLEKILQPSCYFPLYMGLIERETDALMRFKVTIVAIVASIAPIHCFKKPVKYLVFNNSSSTL